jgi:hypothetical protein
MNMSEMRGDLADAIRDSHGPNVKTILEKYEKQAYPPFMLKRMIKKLKDAERLARAIQKRNVEIQAKLKSTREALLARRES